MPEPLLLTADRVEPAKLDAFLRRACSVLKCDFLKENATWWHRVDANRLVIQVEDQIVGYCALIPARVWVTGQVLSALWWVDLVISPEFRGRGLQARLDQQVREMTDLLLGFPNDLAAKIHRRHGWGVRTDMHIQLLPLWPHKVKMVRSANGPRRVFLRAGALALTPLASFWRVRLSVPQPGGVWKLESLDPKFLSAVFMRAHNPRLNTTWRDESYFEWRYGAAPGPQEYSYYLAGDPCAPSHYLVARHRVASDGQRYTRILDLFGDFNASGTLRQLILAAVQDAILHGSGQVTILASHPEVKAQALRLGFLASAPVGFCWLGTSSRINDALAGENYWVLADSDNDAPD